MRVSVTDIHGVAAKVERLVVGGRGNKQVVVGRALGEAAVERACLLHRLHEHCQPRVQHVEALSAPRLLHQRLHTSQVDSLFLLLSSVFSSQMS